MTFTSSEVLTYYTSRIRDLRPNGREWRTPCPVHKGDGLNFSINAETGLATCHSQCGKGWDMISLEMDLFSLDFVQAKERVYRTVGRPEVPWEERNLEAHYEYTDENGKVLYQVLRYYGKEFKQRRPDGSGGWIWGLGDTKRVPFHLVKLRHSEFAAIVEGEKDVLTLERIGMIGTCNNGGAGNFKPELLPYLKDKHIAIFPDNDAPGREHALKVAVLVSSVAKSLKIVELPDLPAKGDVTDFVNKGGTVEQLRELYRKAQPWTPEWEFAKDVPDENDRWVRTLEQEVEAAGGLTAFWDLASFTGLPTPFPKLNWALGGGLRGSEVYVIGANQGAGKTSLALQFALAALRKDLGVLIFSMEMNWRAIFQRLVSIEAFVDLQQFRESQKQKREHERDRFLLARATGELSTRKLLVSTKPSVTPEYIVAEAKRLAKRSAVELVIVDHMQLMGSEARLRSDYEKFTAISRAMKQTAMEIGIPLILVSQTSRSNSREKRSELDVADLRGSGAIEEDAAGVFLLYEDREDAEQARAFDGGRRYAVGPVKCFLKVGKNRYGMQGVYMPLLHFKAQTRFEVPSDDSNS